MDYKFVEKEFYFLSPL